MKKMKKVVKNEKAISPVLAVLLMIAVAVAAALVTYAWVMTYLSSTTGRAGHAVQIQSVDWIDGDSVTIYAQNVGDGTITITSAYVEGAIEVLTHQPVEEGTTFAVELNNTSWSFENGDDVHLKIVCDDGTFTEGTYTVEGLVVVVP